MQPARPSLQLFFFFFSFLLSLELAVLLVAGPSPAAASKDLLQKTCDIMDNKDACNKYLLNAPWALGCSDTKCLAGGVIPQLAKPVTTAGRDYAKNLEDKDPSEELKGCVRNYDDALTSLDDAQDHVQKGEYSEAARSADEAEGYIHTCEDGFSTKPTPLTSTNNEVASVIDLSGNVIDLMYLS